MLFIAKITDESGINTSGIGINQDITLTMEDGSLYVLNDYYVADLDTYQSGSITFPLRNMSVGNHTATLKISDIHNNNSYRSVNFIVSNEPKLLLYNVMNYPNPAIDCTTFTFEHDRIGEALEIELIYITPEEISSAKNYLKLMTALKKLMTSIYLFRLAHLEKEFICTGSKFQVRLIKQNEPLLSVY